MQKHKLHTFINIFGMAVAFTCSIFILLLVYREFSYDDFQQNKSEIYKLFNVVYNAEGERTGTSMAYPMTPALKADNIVQYATRIKGRGKEIRYKDKVLEMSTMLVDNDFFNIFTFPVVKGANTNPLADVGSVVLTEKTAKQLFGDIEPVGKPMEVKLSGQWTTLTVSAVVADIPKTSTINFSLLARSELDPDYARDQNEWNNQSHNVFVKLAGNVTQAQVEKKLVDFVKKNVPRDDAEYEKYGFKKYKNGSYLAFGIIPLKDLHFHQRLGGGNAVSKPFLFILILISLVIILIASFNFINLNIGLSFTRTKEMGIRKCLGAGKRQVWLQVWGESLLTVLSSMIIAVMGVVVLIGVFNKQAGSNLEATSLFTPAVVAIMFAMLIAVSFIASGYPSYIMAKLKTVEILKGKISVKRPGIFRNGLIVVQFVIAIVLMCSTVIIYQQFEHLRNAPLGYNTTSVISIPIKHDEHGIDIVAQMRSRLAPQPSVVSVSGSALNLGLGSDGNTSTWRMGFGYKDKNINGNIMMADYDILKTLSVVPLQGRDFSMDYANDSSISVIFSESYAAQFGEKNLVGQSIMTDSAQPKWNIVGIVPDFYLYSMNNKSEPFVIKFDKERQLSYVLVKVNTLNLTETINMIKETYAKVEPGVEFRGSYVNENIDRWYKNEKRLANIFTAAAIVAIVLSCMGLFGIAFIIIRQRVKEIGVRKVLGASVSNIAAMVTQQFIKPVMLAMFIAIPIAWWAMHKWLQEFIYRIEVQWWVFLVAGVSAIIIAIITVSMQAIKAAIANPVKSLRTE